MQWHSGETPELRPQNPPPIDPSAEAGASRQLRCRSVEDARLLPSALYLIALKEASETKYWIELIIENELAPKQKFTSMLEELEVIIKILVSITKKLKAKIN